MFLFPVFAHYLPTKWSPEKKVLFLSMVEHINITLSPAYHTAHFQGHVLLPRGGVGSQSCVSFNQLQHNLSSYFFSMGLLSVQATCYPANLSLYPNWVDHFCVNIDRGTVPSKCSSNNFILTKVGNSQRSRYKAYCVHSSPPLCSRIGVHANNALSFYYSRSWSRQPLRPATVGI